MNISLSTGGCLEYGIFDSEERPSLLVIGKGRFTHQVVGSDKDRVLIRRIIHSQRDRNSDLCSFGLLIRKIDKTFWNWNTNMGLCVWSKTKKLKTYIKIGIDLLCSNTNYIRTLFLS